jgi:hypothetical protein
LQLAASGSGRLCLRGLWPVACRADAANELRIDINEPAACPDAFLLAVYPSRRIGMTETSCDTADL